MIQSVEHIWGIGPIIHERRLRQQLVELGIPGVGKDGRFCNTGRRYIPVALKQRAYDREPPSGLRFGELEKKMEELVDHQLGLFESNPGYILIPIPGSRDGYFRAYIRRSPLIDFYRAGESPLGSEGAPRYRDAKHFFRSQIYLEFYPYNGECVTDVAIGHRYPNHQTQLDPDDGRDLKHVLDPQHHSRLSTLICQYNRRHPKRIDSNPGDEVEVDYAEIADYRYPIWDDSKNMYRGAGYGAFAETAKFGWSEGYLVGGAALMVNPFSLEQGGVIVPNAKHNWPVLPAETLLDTMQKIFDMAKPH